MIETVEDAMLQLNIIAKMSGKSITIEITPHATTGDVTWKASIDYSSFPIEYLQEAPLKVLQGLLTKQQSNITEAERVLDRAVADRTRAQNMMEDIMVMSESLQAQPEPSAAGI